MTLLDEYAAAIKKVSPRPMTWDDVVGNSRAIEQIREAITASKKSGTPLSHMLLFGPPGTGKSTLSKIVAREFGGLFIETTASTLETPIDLIRFLWQLNIGKESTGAFSTFFIDEIHMLGQAKGRQAIDQESTYALLEDWRFDHNLIRKTVQDVKGQYRILTDTHVLVWPFTCIGATTEPGLLSQPLLRRFLLHIELDPYSEAEITQIIIGAARRLGWSITDGAAERLARFSRRNPGTANKLLAAAHNRAVATEREQIDEPVTQEIIERMKLYPLGLTQTDVKVLCALYDRMPRGMGMAEICRTVGISQSQFSSMVEPYLRFLGFLETLSRRVIRPEGLRYLSEIGAIDQGRREGGAALC
jgi:holliday junction DNA helicase RuvB